MLCRTVISHNIKLQSVTDKSYIKLSALILIRYFMEITPTDHHHMMPGFSFLREDAKQRQDLANLCGFAPLRETGSEGSGFDQIFFDAEVADDEVLAVGGVLAHVE